MHLQRLLRIVIGFGNAHQPAQLQAGQVAHGTGKLQRLLRRQPRLGCSAIHVDLQTDLQRRLVRWALAAQALGDVQPIQRLQPVEMRGHLAGLAALQRADAMPLQPQGLQGLDLGNGLLHIVLAKGDLAGGGGFAHGFGGKGLGNGQQAHRAGRAAGCLFGIGNALPHLSQRGSNGREGIGIGHGQAGLSHRRRRRLNRADTIHTSWRALQDVAEPGTSHG